MAVLTHVAVSESDVVGHMFCVRDHGWVLNDSRLILAANVWAVLSSLHCRYHAENARDVV